MDWLLRLAFVAWVLAIVATVWMGADLLRVLLKLGLG